MTNNRSATPPEDGKLLAYNPPISLSGKGAGAITLQFVPYSKSYIIRIFAMATLSGAIDLVEAWHSSRHSCRDIDTMREALLALYQTDSKAIEVKDAGTVWRFMTAIAALRAARGIGFVGSRRLFERPIAPLVEALRGLGAKILFSADDAGTMRVFPRELPLRGGDISAGTGKLSSQFLSALMLIAPYLSTPLRIAMHLGQRSRPYVELTYKLMQLAGADVSIGEEYVEIKPSGYDKEQVASLLERPESDWTALSYPHSLCALPEGPRSIFVPNCYRETLQGDITLPKMMESFGVVTRFFPKGILIERIKPSSTAPLRLDLSAHIDLVPSMMFTCLALERPFNFLRVGTLKYKESNRLQCLLGIGKSLGYKLEASEDALFWTGAKLPSSSPVIINPCHDHRIAMASCVMALRRNDLRMLTPEVVEKSYPFFWQDGTSIGLTLQD